MKNEKDPLERLGPEFRPSQVELGVPPLTGTMGRCETECAAGMIVRYCQIAGDTWQRIRTKDMSSVMLRDVEEGNEPTKAWSTNPFFNPDMWGLVSGGFAVIDRDPDGVEAIELTAKGYESLRRWVRT